MFVLGVGCCVGLIFLYMSVFNFFVGVGRGFRCLYLFFRGGNGFGEVEFV